jgi:glutamine synthetase type III
VLFIIYNSFNEFYIALNQSSNHFVNELNTRSQAKNTIILTLFLSSVGTLLFTLAILLPVVSSVNKARMKVLSLFIDIPVHHVFSLANKCEIFLTSFMEDHTEEVESEDDGHIKVDE